MSDLNWINGIPLYRYVGEFFVNRILYILQIEATFFFKKTKFKKTQFRFVLKSLFLVLCLGSFKKYDKAVKYLYCVEQFRK